jgi:hypothetical protein
VKAVIYTTHASTTLMRKDIPEIQRIYRAIGEEITIHIVRVSLEPRVAQGEVDWTWFEERLDYADYDAVCFDMTVAEWKASGIKGAAAMYRVNGDPTHEFWMAHDHGKRIGKWSHLYSCSEFVYIFLHELLHGIARFDNYPDVVHEKAANGTMFDLFAVHGKLRAKKSLITLLIEQVKLLKQQLFNMQFLMQNALPIPEANWQQVTQEYLIHDEVNYPRSGVHPGVDFKGDFGDPIFAPHDGEITNSGHGTELGFWVEYKFDDGYMVALHLRSQPKRGKYKKGEQIATLGATGKIDGTHYHLEGWHKPMDRSLLVNEAAVRKHTFDIRNVIG